MAPSHDIMLCDTWIRPQHPQKKPDHRKGHRENGVGKTDQAQVALYCTHNLYLCDLANSHRTIPAAIEIFNECFIPHWGISTLPSHSFNASSPTPLTSFPNTTTVLPECWVVNACKGTLFSTCSTAKISYPSSFNSFRASRMSLKYFQSTV